MYIPVFLSHTNADKPFVRRLKRDLDAQGFDCWIDEAEIKVGDSLIRKICDGLDRANFVIVVLSPNSISSPWVQEELDVAMNQQIRSQRIKVLPVMYQQCEPPGFLLGKKYAKFTDEKDYLPALEQLVNSMGVVFSRSAAQAPLPQNHLGTALDKAVNLMLPVLSAPFHRPFQYLGMPVADAARVVGSLPNEVGNIIVETDDCCMRLEAEGAYVNYVTIDLLQTKPRRRREVFDSEPLLGALSINPAELDLARKGVHGHVYHDHKRRLQIMVQCTVDEGPLSVAFSSKYYGT